MAMLDQDASSVEPISEGAIMQALNWTYDNAVNGLPGLDSAQAMAEDYMAEEGSLDEKVNSLIRWQISKAGTSGFLTGLGGILTLPIMIPANISSVMFVQVRMIAAVAHMGGYDLKSDKVQALVYACLTGNAVKDVLKEAGVLIGTKLTTQAIKSVSGRTILEINKKVGFRLLTKFGEKGAVNLGKAVPLVSGIIGGTFDAVATNMIGNIARETFISSESEATTTA
ncbi:MAG: EcsC family protein [Mariprofundaceae bacterium]